MPAAPDGVMGRVAGLRRPLLLEAVPGSLDGESLAGNGMHVDVMNAWAIYIMSNVVRRSSLQQMPVQIEFKPGRRPAFKNLYQNPSSSSSPFKPVRKRPASTLASSASPSKPVRKRLASSASLEFLVEDEEAEGRAEAEDIE